MTIWNRAGVLNQNMSSIASEFADTTWGWHAERLLRQSEKVSSQEQLYELLNLAEMGLALSSAESGRRRALSLALLDHPLSARYNPYWGSAVGEFYQRALSRALAQIGRAQVTSGWRVWKIYNMGFVVKTATHTIGFDIHPGWVFQNPLSNEQQEQLADMLDLLLISHYHADHLNPSFMQKMVERKKPVVLPASVWRLPNTGRLDNGPKRYIQEDQESHQTFAGLYVHSYLGAQWRVIRNAVYVVEVDGLHILHPGDNENLQIYECVAQNHDIDLYLANCWAKLGESVARIRPHTVITGHEQEISHPSPFLHSFQSSFQQLAHMRRDNPDLMANMAAHVLAWGEGAEERRSRGAEERVANDP